MKKKLLISSVAAAMVIVSNFSMGYALVASADTMYRDSSNNMVRHVESITYSRKDSNEYHIVGNLPTYGKFVQNAGCANIAGTEIIGYYDRFCENLVPDFQTYYMFSTMVVYYSGGTALENVMASLYTLMGTSSSGGTTYNGFQNGMNSYVSGQGYTYGIEDLGATNIEKYKTAVESNKPVAIFLSKFSLIAYTTDSNGCYTEAYDTCNIAHVVVGCGYNICSYYDEYDELIATRTYLRVASGLDGYDITYLCLDGRSSIDRMTAVTIT